MAAKQRNYFHRSSGFHCWSVHGFGVAASFSPRRHFTAWFLTQAAPRLSSPWAMVPYLCPLFHAVPSIALCAIIAPGGDVLGNGEWQKDYEPNKGNTHTSGGFKTWLGKGDLIRAAMLAGTMTASD
ncbi:hypothetical protein IW261DRAFT_1426208 [Armillaria novae-zelandiae]|uniref:Uncharacterized protein n=1 Tax=Armillaria novae-zelandiae TaxID=153914 RepID=A0AA39NN37_9AGAR|nr:hypothetical protein IW261DRAFT_1426208 [Armillaria novae-zelandiae]